MLRLDFYNGMNSRSSQIKSKSCKNWFEKRTLRGTEAEKVEKLSPLFFSTSRNLLIWDQVEMLCSCY